MRLQRMCPNEACEKYRQPTGLMGGCECGAPFVPFKTLEDETNEALWDLMPDHVKRMVVYAILGQRQGE